MNEYNPQVGDVVKITKGTPDKPGYGEYVYTLVEYEKTKATEGRVSIGVLESMVMYGWEPKLLSRPEPPLPEKPGTIGWTNVKGDDDNRYVAIRFSRPSDSRKWRTSRGDGHPGQLQENDQLINFRQGRLVPADIMEEAEDWYSSSTFGGFGDGMQAVAILKKLLDETYEQEGKME